MSGGSSTHLIEMRTDVVIKRYRSQGNDEPEHEWRALNLLNEHAPGLAPAPVTADLQAEPPVVVMSRLPGTPPAGEVTGELAAAVAGAIARMQEAIPPGILTALPPRAGHPIELLRQVRTWFVAGPPPTGDPTVTEAFGAALDWAGRPGLEASLGLPVRPVFGTGDGNLANYLWDGTDVRLVDFEYSGRSDRAYELAEVTEHISVHEGGTNGMAQVLDHFNLDLAEAGRLGECRRLLALFWLFRLASGGRDRRDASAGQANRLLALLQQPTRK